MKLKIGDWRIQELIHDLSYENMEGQEATAHQSLFMTNSQDRSVEKNFREDWPDVREGCLPRFLDKNTPGPADGSTTDADLGKQKI